MRHVESNTQQYCVKWFKYYFDDLAQLLFAIPNGARVSLTQARILKAEGMEAGVADLLLLVPSRGYHGMAIEMKTKTGRQSDSQKAFQKAVESQGYKYIIVRSVEDFRAQVKEYLGREI